MDYNKLYISKEDETHIIVGCELSTAKELYEYFTFYVPGYKFMPAYQNRMWDGKIRLYNANTRKIYAGLLPHVERFAQKNGYAVEYDSSIEPNDEFSIKEAHDFSKTLGAPFEARDYQLKAFAHSVRNRRSLLLSPTASGKSFIIYHLVRWYSAKTLVIVPTTSLVHQLVSDFKDYGWDAEENCHKIMAGQDKHSDKQVIVSTWQSIFKMPKSYFQQFDVVIGDEAHLFKAKSLMSILEKLSECKYRFGLTGTLDGSTTHKLVLEGLFGEVKQVTQTKELIEGGQLAKFKIKALILSYPEEMRRQVKNYKYADEVDFIVTNESRNKFIKNLAVSLNGNTLLLYQFVDKHGSKLYDLISKSVDEGRKVFFVHGNTHADDREQVRSIVEKETDAIIIASYGTFSTGVNIKNLHTVVFTSPSKSKIRTLQSIGRGLRKSDTKTDATLIDIADDLSSGSKKNYTIQHFSERMKMYNEEGFEYKIYKINIKGE
jgi:superfamily II DNA or RNA helicase